MNHLAEVELDKLSISTKDRYKIADCRTKWICFKDEYPKRQCGLIIKIENKDERVNEKLFYGYVFPTGDHIYIVMDLTSACKGEVDEMGNCIEMNWYALKDYRVEDIYWYRDATGCRKL